MSKKREYDEEYKEQAVRLAKNLGSAKAAAEELHLPHLSFLQALLPAPCTHFHIVYFLHPFFLHFFFSYFIPLRLGCQVLLYRIKDTYYPNSSEMTENLQDKNYEVNVQGLLLV